MEATTIYGEDNMSIVELSPSESAGIEKSNSISFADNIMLDVKEQGYYATFSVEDMADKKKLFAARNANELLREHMGDEIEVENFVIDTQTINDADTGAKTIPCVHIISTDGKVYQSGSTGVIKSVFDIISSFGLPETWDESITVKCIETHTANGFRYKQLEVLM